MILYFFIKFLNFLTMMIFLRQANVNIFHENTSPWFALGLAWMYLITMVIQKVKPSYVLTCALVLCFFAGYTDENTTLFVWLRTVNFYPFFYIGCILDLDKVTGITEKKVCKIISAFGLCLYFILIRCYAPLFRKIGGMLSGQNAYSVLKQYELYGGAIRMGLIVLGLVLTFFIFCIAPKKQNLITKYGQRTLTIYATHFCFIIIFCWKIKIFHMIKSVVGAYWIVFTVPLAVIITLGCGNKLFDRWITNIKKIKYIHS